MKTASLKKFFNEFTHNEIALYLLLGIALINLLTYLQYNYLGGVIIFLVVGLIASHFTKNMVIVLAGTILVTNLFVSFGILSNLGVREGLDNSKKNVKLDDKDKDDDDDDDTCKSTKDCKKGMYCDMRSKKCVGKDMDDDMAIDLTETSLVDIRDPSTPQVNSQAPAPSPPAPSPQPIKSGFKNFDEEDEETITINQKSKKYSNAMSDAQNNLKKILGGNGTQNLDTAELLKQQKQLMEAMQGMQPLIDGANGMLNKIGSSPLGKMLGVSNN